MFHPQRLRCCDLDMVNILAIPDRLDDGVGEPEGEDVLHRLFAEIVVNAIDLLLVYGPTNHCIESLCAGGIPSKRLLDDKTCPALALALAIDQAVFRKARDDRCEEHGRRGEVENAIAP